MRLTHLRAVQFRNHLHSDVTLSPGLTLFVGGNAQGKSSLLEAVQVTATGRSFRARHDVEMITLDEAWARVRTGVERRGRLEEIDVALRREEGADPPRAAREIRVNGVPVRRGELFGHLLCVLAAPDDTEIVTGSPLYRRRLIDLLLAQTSPAYYFTVQRYARVLLQRNRLLRTRGGGLEAWDEQIALLGAAVTVRRGEVIARLAAAAQQIFTALTHGQEQLVLTYAPSLRGDGEGPMTAWARDALLRRRGEEIVRGATVVGPHRDDLTLHVNGRELRTFGSRGQQLMAMLAVRLAERRVLFEETGEEPVLMLDDVLLTLDEARQAQLLDGVRHAQVLMTATTTATLRAIPRGTALFRVTGGTVEIETAHLA